MISKERVEELIKIANSKMEKNKQYVLVSYDDDGMLTLKWAYLPDHYLIYITLDREDEMTAAFIVDTTDALQHEFVYESKKYKAEQYDRMILHFLLALKNEGFRNKVDRFVKDVEAIRSNPKRKDEFISEACYKIPNVMHLDKFLGLKK